jgi:hypothetical protein
MEGKINPSTFPGLKPRVCSGLILSGALDPILKDDVWRRRSIKIRNLQNVFKGILSIRFQTL